MSATKQMGVFQQPAGLFQFPQSAGSVIRAGNEMLVVRAELDRFNAVGVAVKLFYDLAFLHVPDIDTIIS
jgi:hypothetical protein